jgi:hypothetical protein
LELFPHALFLGPRFKLQETDLPAGHTAIVLSIPIVDRYATHFLSEIDVGKIIEENKDVF